MRIKKQLRRRVLLLPLLFFFCLLFTAARPNVYAASNPKVVSIAKKHVLKNAKIVKRDSGRKLVCVLNGKRLKKKNYWFCVDGSVYYNNQKALVQTGAFSYKGFRYFADREGRLKISAFQGSGTNLRYFGSTGAMLSGGWHTAAGSRRFFDQDGRILVNQWIGNQYVGYDGAVISSLSRRWEPWNPAADANGMVAYSPDAAKKHMIIIGASRVVYMSWDVPKDSRITYIASGGEGIEWLTSEAIPLLDFWLSVYPASKVVVQLGNNGLMPTKKSWPKYRSAYSYLLRRYPRNSFYFMDILPGNLSSSAKKNRSREDFNDRLRKAFPAQWIGGYDYMLEKGFTTIDKIHYDKATNRMIYAYILREAGW